MLVTPFPLLRELAAHEQELLAGMSIHESIVGTKVGKSLPFVTWHSTEERTLAMHDLIV